MRIVAGMYRGRNIEAPSGEGTRPTTDRVREALFSSLYSLRGGFEGAIVLDAFAGSGALGLEALSRGASSATFYERDEKAAGVLKRNVAAFKLAPAQASVVQRDVMQAPPAAQNPPFDLVFFDPPYDNDPQEMFALLKTLRDAGALASDAIITYEHSHKSSAAVADAAQDAGFDVYKCKKYGKTAITILE